MCAHTQYLSVSACPDAVSRNAKNGKRFCVFVVRRLVLIMRLGCWRFCKLMPKLWFCVIGLCGLRHVLAKCVLAFECLPGCLLTPRSAGNGGICFCDFCNLYSVNGNFCCSNGFCCCKNRNFYCKNRKLYCVNRLLCCSNGNFCCSNGFFYSENRNFYSKNRNC